MKQFGYYCTYFHDCLNSRVFGNPNEKLQISIKSGKGKGKAIPLEVLTGPGGSRSLRLPDFKTIGT
jgi:hypothetical protein